MVSPKTTISDTAGSDTTSSGEADGSQAGRSLAGRAGRRYLFWLFLLPTVAYIFPFVAERAPVLNMYAVSRWGQLLDYLYAVKGVDADVVVFGDSSAYFDEDTVRLSHDLGLKVITLPHNQGCLPILQDQMLRRYLAENRPPRLIVFHFTAWDMNFKTATNPFVYDGFELLIRHGSASELLDLFRRYPGGTLLFPFRFYRIPNRISNYLMLKRLPEVKVAQGHTVSPLTVALKPGCSISKSLFDETQTQSVRELVHDFTTPQTKTLVYVPALPDCANAEQMRDRPHPGVVAAPPVILPVQDFANDESYTHVVPTGIEDSTLAFEKAIQTALQQPQQR